MTTKRSAGWIGALGLTAVAVLPLIGCGSDRMNSPAAPSSAQAPVVSSSPSVNASGSIDGDASPSLTTASGDTASALTVTALVSGTSCPTLQFKIESYVIQTNASTKYDGGSCANIQAGAKLTLSGARANDPAVFVASLITFRTTTTTPTTTEPVEGEGVVSSVRTGTSCPTLEFVLERSVIKVDASTAYEGGGCADIKVGTRVHVKGSLNADGSVSASHVSVKAPQHRTEPVEVEGVVSGVRTGTSCPTLEFVIERYVIKVDASTAYEGGGCADIAVGVRLHVKGTLNADGSVMALRVILQGRKTHREDPAEGDGEVTSLVAGTACPTLKFQIREYTIAVDGSTEYVGGTCADIAVGVKVGVKGSVDADKNVTARRITFRH